MLLEYDCLYDSGGGFVYRGELYGADSKRIAGFYGSHISDYRGVSPE